MKKNTTNPKLSSEELNNCFAGLEEALMADTMQLKAIDEDIKVLTLKLKKLNFESTGTTYVNELLVAANGKIGYDYDKKTILFLATGTVTAKALSSTTPTVRKDAHKNGLDELLVHLRREFESKTKPIGTYAATVAVSPASQSVKTGLFGSKAS